MKAKELRKLVMRQALANEPVAPLCIHFGECGGCALQDRAYEAQVAAKLDGLNAVWKDAGLPEELLPLEFQPSPHPYEYRARMDYVCTKGRFGLRKRRRYNFIIDLETCHLIPPHGFTAARAVWEQAMQLGIPDHHLKTHEGLLRYIVVRRSPQNTFMLAAVMASAEPMPEMEQLAAFALQQPGVESFYWLLNDKLTDLSFGDPVRHWGFATLEMHVGALRLAIGPNTFFQNNLHLLPQLLDEMAEATPPGYPLADLYGGVGLIGLWLAERAERVLTVEEVAESSQLAEQNIRSNGVERVHAVRADVLTFLREQTVGALPVMIADPPRTGLGPEVCQEVLRLQPERLVYLSCNPLTQCQDYELLRAQYRPLLLRGYDMFPQTPHMESLLVLERDT